MVFGGDLYGPGYSTLGTFTFNGQVGTSSLAISPTLSVAPGGGPGYQGIFTLPAGNIFGVNGNSYLGGVTTIGVAGSTTNNLTVNGKATFASNLAIGGSLKIGNVAPTNYPNYGLAVAGSVVAQQSVVTAPHNWADFVFDSAYVMPTLAETKAFIKENHHLPSIPSEKEVMKNGFDLAEMDAKLLQKIEELYLHIIEQEKQIENLKQQVNKLNSK